MWVWKSVPAILKYYEKRSVPPSIGLISLDMHAFCTCHNLCTGVRSIDYSPIVNCDGTKPSRLGGGNYRYLVLVGLSLHDLVQIQLHGNLILAEDILARSDCEVGSSHGQGYWLLGGQSCQGRKDCCSFSLENCVGDRQSGAVFIECTS